MKKFILFFLFIFSLQSYSQENCTNGIDDDGDNLIDINDPDCSCNASSNLTSIIPNHSFEIYSSCPTSYSYPGNDQLSKAVPWIQATDATSDYHNKCGYYFPAINNTSLFNFPNGNGVAGTIFLNEWKEYIGTELISPMQTGVQYQLSFNIGFVKCNDQGEAVQGNNNVFEPINITLYGCANGNNLPVPTVDSPDIADPTWFEIGNVTYIPNTQWSQITMIYTPTFDVNAIMIGAPRVLPPSYINPTVIPYFLFDNLLLNKSSDFGVNIEQSGNFCENTLVLSANLTQSFSGNQTYQWYFNGIAIAGATSQTYNVQGFLTNIGQYSVRVSDGPNCYISVSHTTNNLLDAPTYTTIQPTCINNLGSITITTPASEYSFDNGLTWQTSPTKNSLSIGTYYIKIKSLNGCVSSATGVLISEPNLLSFSNISVIQPSNCTERGVITINSSISSEYSFDGGLTWTTNPIKNNLIAGTYQIQIKDVNGCKSSFIPITIDGIFLPQPNYTIVNPTCDTGGSITITTPAVQYSFDNGNTWGTDNTLSNIAPGSYLIAIIDTNGCVSYAANPILNSQTLNISPSYTSIDPTCDTGGSISITTLANEYSFDGGTTWTTNPIATNLPFGDYIIAVKNSQYCISYLNYVYLNKFYLQSPTVIVTQPTCNTLGQIEITTTANEYSFDGGITWSNNPIASNLTSGTYIVLIRDSIDCYSYNLYINLNFVNLPTPNYTVINPACGDFGSISITSAANEYSFDGGITWTTNPVANNLSAGFYTIIVRDNPMCQSNYLYVNLEELDTLYPQYELIDAGCEKYGSITITTYGDLYSFDGGTTWTTNPTLSNLSGNQQYDLRVKILPNCLSQINTTYMYSQYYPIPNATDYITNYCDDLNNNFEIVNLQQFESNIINNSSDFTFNYFNTQNGANIFDYSDLINNYTTYNITNNATIYVRVTSINNCYKVIKLNINLIKSPLITDVNETYPLCVNNSISLNAGVFDSYLWSTGQTTQSITINQAGNYTVTVFENHANGLVCSSIKTFNVFLSNTATISQIETVDWTENQNTITVYLNSSSIGDYEYSIDGVNYQDSNVFSNLYGGIYFVYVRDKNGCGVIFDEVFLLNYPKFFTPNGDGYNDTWSVNFSYFEKGISTQIYDRYGKLIKVLNYKETWDGKYNGSMLPSDDYWFVVNRTNGKVYKGHFAMKR